MSNKTDAAYDKILEALDLCVKGDDILNQEDFYKVYDLLIQAALDMAVAIGRAESLVKKYPFLYSKYKSAEEVPSLG